jgi:predicted RecB family nuclease
MATKWQLATCLTVQFQTHQSALETCIHAIERAPGKGSGKAAQFIPIRFIFTNKLSRDVKLLLAFDALVFSEAFEPRVGLGKIVHGENFATLNVKTTALIGEVRKRIEKIAAILSNKTPVDLILNRHCPECEFRDRCRQKALETDDLSLLAGMSAKERQKLRGKRHLHCNATLLHISATPPA